MDEKHKKYIVAGIVLLLIIIGLLIWFLMQKKVYKKEIGIPENTIYMHVDEIKLLPYVASDDEELVFESSNNDIAKIDRQGYIYAKKLGRTRISIYYVNDLNSIAYCDVYVTENGGQAMKDSDETENGNSDTSKIEDPPKDEKPKATCKLSVSKDGVITSTTKNALKYGFDKNNIDSNELSRHVDDIPNKEEKEVEGWTYYRIRYYVENEEGVKGNCSIVVIKKCNNGECIYELN